MLVHQPNIGKVFRTDIYYYSDNLFISKVSYIKKIRIDDPFTSRESKKKMQKSIHSGSFARRFIQLDFVQHVTLENNS